MTDKFTWRPIVDGNGRKSTGRVKRAQFGDGYSQSFPDGINVVMRDVNVAFSGYAGYIKPIEDFLESHYGRSFLFKPSSMNSEGLYYCDTFDTTEVGGGYFRLTAMFRLNYQADNNGT